MGESSELIRHLRADGHRLTPQRRIVLEVLDSTEHHLSVEEIARQITERYPTITIDLATIYRTLKWLRDAQLVSETRLGEAHTVYALVSRHHHHHLICQQCRTMLEVDPQIFAEVSDLIEHRYGFTPHMHHIAIFGICESCRSG